MAKRWPWLLALGGVLLAAGCGELGEVQTLQATAAELRVALPGVSGDLYASCLRRAALVARIPAAELPAQAGAFTPDCAPAKALATQVSADQAVLVDYLEALGRLGAGDDSAFQKAVGVDEGELGALSAGPQGSAALTADAARAGVAALSLTGKLSSLATAHAREREVRRLVQEADPGVQALAAALGQVGGVDYGVLLADEKGFLDAYYQGPLAAAGPADRLMLILVQRQYDGDVGRWQRRRDAAVDYREVMRQVASLHAQLAVAARERAGFAGRVKALTPAVDRLRNAVATLQTEVH